MTPTRGGSTRRSGERVGGAPGSPARADEQPGVLAALARSWPLAALLVLAGSAAGAGWAWRTPDVHTAETRLSIGSQELSAQAVPGYAAALQTMTSNYARYVRTTDAVREDLVDSLGPEASTLVEVTASPIPESNILRIEVEATDPAVAVEAADRVGANLTEAIARTPGGVDAQRDELAAVSQALAEAEQQEQSAQLALDRLLGDADADQGAVDAARRTLVEASTAVAVRTVEQEALSSTYRNAVENSGRSTTLSVIRPAEVTTDDGTSSLQRWSALGLIAGAGAAVLMALLVDRSRRSRSRKSVALVAPSEDAHDARSAPRVANWR